MTTKVKNKDSNNDSKHDFILELSRMTHKEINDLIKSIGKPPKLVEAIIHLDEWVD